MSMGSYPGGVDWVSFADAARRNAAALLADAQLLLENSRYARSYAIAVLGFEELGKYYLCLNAAAGFDDQETVWRQLGRHDAKLQVAASTVALFAAESPAADVVAQFETFVAKEAATKLHGLYVDWDDGKVTDPADVPAADAAEVVALLREVVDFVVTHDLDLLTNLAAVDLDQLKSEQVAVMDRLRDHIKSLGSAEEDDALARSAVDDVVAGLRQILRTPSPEGHSED